MGGSAGPGATATLDFKERAVAFTCFEANWPASGLVGSLTEAVGWVGGLLASIWLAASWRASGLLASSFLATN